MKIYDKLICENDQNFSAIYNKAIASEKMGNSSESLRLLEQVTLIKPDFSKAWTELADIYDNIGAQDKAQECRAKVDDIKSKE
jgi:tetratricopeptide (TPR) repeat protein